MCFGHFQHILESVMTSTKKQQIFGVTLVVVLMFALSVVAIVWTLIPYSRMYRALSHLDSALVENMLPSGEMLSSVYGQDYLQIYSRQIIVDRILAAYTTVNLKEYAPVLESTLKNLERETERRPTCISCYLTVGKAYDRLAEFKPENATDYLKKAEEAYLAGLSFVPGNQAFIEAYAANLSNQGRGDEGLAMIDESLDIAPNVPGLRYYRALLSYKANPSSDAPLADFEYALSRGYNLVPASTKTVYERMLGRYYRAGDKERFLIAARRLAMLDKKQSAIYSDIVKYVEEKGTLPVIGFGG